MNTETFSNVNYSLAALYNESVDEWRNRRAVRECQPATTAQKDALRAKLAKADGVALGALVQLYRDYFNGHPLPIAGWECWSAMRSLDLAMNSNAYRAEQNA